MAISLSVNMKLRIGINYFAHVILMPICLNIIQSKWTHARSWKSELFNFLLKKLNKKADVEKDSQVNSLEFSVSKKGRVLHLLYWKADSIFTSNSFDEIKNQ